MNKMPIRDEGSIGLAAWSGQSRGMVAAHQHLDLEINYLLNGTMRYLVGGSLVELPPHRLCLLWGGVPHQMIREHQAVEAIWVTVPLAIVLRWKLPDGVMRPLLAGGFVADAAPRPSDLTLLHQWLDDLPRLRSGRRDVSAVPTDYAETSEIALLEIEARLRRLALGVHETSGVMDVAHLATVHPDRSLAAVETMARFIAQNFLTPLSVTQIAASAYLHPNYAMTLFRQHVGMTLSQYLILQRVAHAQRLLATTSDPIPTIALGSGFGSVSRFYEAFHKQTGISPRRFRTRLESTKAIA